MRNKVVVILFLLIAGSLFISNAAFAAWTQAKGHAYNQLTLSYYVTDEKFSTVQTDASGNAIGLKDKIDRINTATFRQTSITYYGEYGITDTLTVFTAIPWKWSKSDDTLKYAGENGPSGVGDIDLGLRYNLSQNLLGNVFSIQGAVKIPAAYKYGHPLEDLSLGDGQYDATLLLQLGRGIGKGYAWLNAGYKWRFENDKFDPLNFKPSDQIKVTIGGGYAVTPWLSIRGLIDWAKSVGNASVSQDLINTNIKDYSGMAEAGGKVLIKDTLGLEPDSLSVGVDLAFNLNPKWQTVLSYNTDINRVGYFRSRDWAVGKTYSVAVVYLY